MEEWWVSIPRMAVFVEVQQGIITDTAPITEEFIGQPFTNLLDWLGKFGKVTKACFKRSNSVS